MKWDVFRWAEQIPSKAIKHRVLDQILAFGIPFNLGLGLHIEELSAERAIIHSPKRWKRRNHVGGAHACALALMGEYAAGLLIAQNFSPARYRYIIGELQVKYHKQGRGDLVSRTKSPAQWPDLSTGEGWIDMHTEIVNDKDEPIAEVHSRWQVKIWEQVRHK